MFEFLGKLIQALIYFGVIFFGIVWLMWSDIKNKK